MPIFNISTSWEMSANVEVQASDLDEAVDIVESSDFPLPTDASYIAGSFSVDQAKSSK